jgi:DNA-binding NtrC family response regulator
VDRPESLLPYRQLCGKISDLPEETNKKIRDLSDKSLSDLKTMVRILFVDDELRVLEGLRRTLRPMRDRWEMDFVASAVCALDSLDKRPFDVVVTDMRMPAMDGLALLNVVSGRHPGLIRVVLSGYSDVEQKVRAAGLAHTYLSKPCAIEVLTTAISSMVGQSG